MVNLTDLDFDTALEAVAQRVVHATPPEPRTTSERLLAETILVIERGGETSVRIRDIGEACGVTSPIIYKAFESRDGLIVAAQAERFRRAIASVATPFTEAISSATTVLELRRVMTLLLAATQHPLRAPFRRLQFEVLGASIHRPTLRAAIDRELQVVIGEGAAALEAAQHRGLIRATANPTEFMWWFYGQVQGRLLIEQSSAQLSEEAWNATAAQAVFAVLFDDA
jgi:AcrR family transcriptional regulator